MLRRVGIPDPERRIDRYPHEFSGGMRQRICIALALIAGPDLLIADEPTTALDVTLEAQIIHLLRELKDEVKGAILFVSHHLGLVAELCDRVTVMYAGEVVETGSVHDVFHRPRHPYTAGAAALRSGAHRAGDARAADDRGRGAEPGRCCPRAACSGRAARARSRAASQPPPLYPAAVGPAPIRACRPLPSARPWLSCSGSTDLVVRYRALGPLAALLAGIRDPFVDAVLEVSFALAARRDARHRRRERQRQVHARARDHGPGQAGRRRHRLRRHGARARAPMPRSGPIAGTSR